MRQRGIDLILNLSITLKTVTLLQNLATSSNVIYRVFYSEQWNNLASHQIYYC